MKIESKILKEYITKVSLNATIPTLNLNFTEDGVTTFVKNVSNHAMTKGLLKKEAFEEYEAIGEIYIKNSKMLLETLKTFDNIVSLEQSETVLMVFDDTRQVNLMLAEKKICDNLKEGDKPEIETTIEVNIESSVLKRIVNDMSFLNINNAKFVKKETEMYIQIGKEKEFDYIKNFIKCDSKENVSVGIGASFPEVVASLTGTVTMKLGNEVPIVFINNNEHMDIEIMVAPFLESDD